MLRQKLISGEINVLFVVDIFNEGVDIPEIDTVLFLRPTESLTVFLQQLGRGLRLNDGKECLTVLDFVGNARPEYDFSSKFRGMVGRSQMSIVDEIENNFPHAPLGCSIIRQKQAKETILNNIKHAFVNQRRLISWIIGFAQHTNAPLTLNNFLNQYPSVSLEDVYKTKINGGGGWTRLCIKSGEIHDSIDTSIEKAIFRGISNRILQCTSFSYLMFLLDLFDKKGEWERTDDVQNQWALMAHYDFWQVPGKECGFSSLTESLKAITKEIILNKEILSVLECAMDRIENKEIKMNISTPSALHIHARYSRDEILASYGVHTFNMKSSSREGVVDIHNLNTELLFVTLQKTEKRFSPTTLYHDYAINKELFHWQSQNSARPDRGKGLKYINHKKSGKTIILFVREQSIDEFGRTMGFVNLGPVYIESYNGSQPMNITWKLEQPLPSYLWREAVKLAVG